MSETEERLVTIGLIIIYFIAPIMELIFQATLFLLLIFLLCYGILVIRFNYIYKYKINEIIKKLINRKFNIIIKPTDIKTKIRFNFFKNKKTCMITRIYYNDDIYYLEYTSIKELKLTLDELLVKEKYKNSTKFSTKSFLLFLSYILLLILSWSFINFKLVFLFLPCNAN